MYDDLVRSLHEGAEFLECSTPGIKNSFAKMCHNAADAIEELSLENESLAKSVNEASEILRRRWIPVTEKLPIGGDKSGEICENVWLFFDDGSVYPGWMNGINEKVYYLDDYNDCLMKAPMSRVKMWQPRPEPPKEE